MFKQYQTLGEFLRSPFGQTNPRDNTELNRKYSRLVEAKKIVCENWTKLNDTYMIHIKIPSESNEGIMYDVVIQFFTDNDDIMKESTLSNYFIQFYSNSPSFIYKYAVLYKVNGYLIDALYEKLDDEYSNVLPDKANPKYKMDYDKSIYFACKFLQDRQYGILQKSGLRFYKEVTFEKFINSISDFQTMKADSELKSLEKDIENETVTEMEAAKKQRSLLDRLNPLNILSSGKKPKVKAKHDTLAKDSPRSVTINKKKTPTRSTSQGKSGIHVINKKRPTRSTRKS